MIAERHMTVFHVIVDNIKNNSSCLDQITVNMIKNSSSLDQKTVDLCLVKSLAQKVMDNMNLEGHLQ